MPRSRIIVALDGMNVETATALGSTLSAHVAGGKANDLLDEGGASVLNLIYYDALQAAANGVVDTPIRMADPKIHDIPETVYNRIRKYDGMADFVTIHGTNSVKALLKAREAADACSTKPKIIVVTVTTDILSEECQSIFGTKNVQEKVAQLVDRAKMARLDGIVCSPHEVKMVRNLWPAAIIIVPGVRSPGADTHDQQRVGTPEQTIRDGADYIVCGREITQAIDKVAAAEHINTGVSRGLEQRT